MNRRPSRPAGLAVAFGVLLALGACTSDEEAPQEPGVQASVPTDRVTDLRPDEPSMSPGDDASPLPFGPDDAGVTALGTAEAVAENGQAFELDRDDDGWEVHVAAGDVEHEVHVGPDGSTVEQQEQDELDGEDRARLDAASISATEAAVTALNDVQGTLEEIDIDGSPDSPVWEIQVRTTDGADVDVVVDAVTGEIQ